MWRAWGVVAGVAVFAGIGAGEAQAQHQMAQRQTAQRPAVQAPAVQGPSAQGQPQVPAFWLGAWSPDAACGPDAVAHVFGPGSFELREGIKRVYRGEATLEVKGEILTVRLVHDIENLVEDDDGPRAGDAIAYRKRGQKIRPDTFTRDGLTHANPDFGPDFHRCGS